MVQTKKTQAPRSGREILPILIDFPVKTNFLGNFQAYSFYLAPFVSAEKNQRLRNIIDFNRFFGKNPFLGQRAPSTMLVCLGLGLARLSFFNIIRAKQCGSPNRSHTEAYWDWDSELLSPSRSTVGPSAATYRGILGLGFGYDKLKVCVAPFGFQATRAVARCW